MTTSNIDIDKILAEIFHPEDEDYLGFQKGGIVELLLRKNVLLADEMGLGKTIQLIGYMNVTRPGAVLIIVPNNLRLNWYNELMRWLDPELLEKYGEIEQVTTGVCFPGKLMICSYEGLTKWHAELKTMQEWDLIIIDEAHYVKNRSTKRAAALASLRDLQCKKVMLTGTPICNYPYEIFPLIHFLAPDDWPSAAAFERRYCPYKNKYGYHLDELQNLLREGVIHRTGESEERVSVVDEGQNGLYTCRECGFETSNEVAARDHVQDRRHRMTSSVSFSPRVEVIHHHERSPGVMVRRLKKEVLPQLPRKRRQVIELPAEGELLALVEKENELWAKHAEIQLEMDKALELVPAESEVDFESLIENLRFTKRYFFEEIALIRHALAKAKVPYVIEHLESILETKDKVVVFIHHRDVGEAFLEHFKDKAVLVYGGMSQNDVYAAKDKFWQDDNCQLFIGSLKMAGVGLNLQVASNIVFAELDWVPGVITQAEDRCHRIGQEKSLLVQHLVAHNSMDSNMAKRIIAKQKGITKALNRPDPERSVA